MTRLGASLAVVGNFIPSAISGRVNVLEEAWQENATVRASILC